MSLNLIIVVANAVLKAIVFLALVMVTGRSWVLYKTTGHRIFYNFTWVFSAIAAFILYLVVVTIHARFNPLTPPFFILGHLLHWAVLISLVFWLREMRTWMAQKAKDKNDNSN